MQQTATRYDFSQLSNQQQEKYSALIRECKALGLPMRCEMAGKDFTVIVAPGLPLAQHWINCLDIDE